MAHKVTFYFGTDLTSAGHHLWEINDEGTDLGRKFYAKNKLPFCPDYICEGLAFGQISWQHHNLPNEIYTVCAISGGVADNRPGGKSVFVIYGAVPFMQAKEIILNTPICKKLIDKMNFQINWRY